MRISDWSSDVCSSDLGALPHRRTAPGRGGGPAASGQGAELQQHQRHLARRDRQRPARRAHAGGRRARRRCAAGDRKSVVDGKSVAGRVDLGGRRILKKTKNKKSQSKKKTKKQL